MSNWTFIWYSGHTTFLKVFCSKRGSNERVHEEEWEDNNDESGLLLLIDLLFHCLLCLNGLQLRLWLWVVFFVVA